MQHQPPPCTESPWWLAIAIGIVSAEATAIVALAAYVRQLLRERTKDLHRVIGWPVSGAPPTTAELLQPATRIVRPKPAAKRKADKPP